MADIAGIAVCAAGPCRQWDGRCYWEQDGSPSPSPYEQTLVGLIKSSGGLRNLATAVSGYKAGISCKFLATTLEVTQDGAIITFLFLVL